MNPVFEINVDKSHMIYVLLYFLLPDCPRGYFGEECAGKCSVLITAMVVTTLMVCVTLDASQDGEESTAMKVYSFTWFNLGSEMVS